MILIDTSVWIDHLRNGDEALAGWLDTGIILTHPFVIGELSLGNLRQREIVLNALSDLPRVNVGTDTEILHFIDRNGLSGRGIGCVEAHLLAGTLLTAGARLWTKDKRLDGVARQLGLAFTPS